MSPRIRAAHEALLQKLPVRTHYQRPQLPLQSPIEARGLRTPTAGVARPLVVDGVQYASVSEAMRSLGVGQRRIYIWIDEGRAAYADQEDQ
jgi:hypothetical protein